MIHPLGPIAKMSNLTQQHGDEGNRQQWMVPVLENDATADRLRASQTDPKANIHFEPIP